jgi:hypothetical protein
MGTVVCLSKECKFLLILEHIMYVKTTKLILFLILFYNILKKNEVIKICAVSINNHINKNCLD